MLRLNHILASCESALTLRLRVAQRMLIHVPSNAQLKAASAKDGEAVSFDATLVLGRPGKAAPGILFLHGGPHSAYAASYVHSVAFLASLGYNVVIPNYRWSECHTIASSWGYRPNVCKVICLQVAACKSASCVALYSVCTSAEARCTTLLICQRSLAAWG